MVGVPIAEYLAAFRRWPLALLCVIAALSKGAYAFADCHNENRNFYFGSISYGIYSFAAGAVAA
jgi:hypothetical protein